MMRGFWLGNNNTNNHTTTTTNNNANNNANSNDNNHNSQIMREARAKVPHCSRHPIMIIGRHVMSTLTST